MKLFLIGLSLFFELSLIVEGIQPYFPSQIVFSVNDARRVIVVDEVNQRAYNSIPYGISDEEVSYAMKNFPYALPNSPQSKYYVQLLVDSTPHGCMYGTYWKYGGNIFNSFPAHWLNQSVFQVKNYFQFKYTMIHSDNKSSSEDYWYSNQTCRVDDGNEYPCEEIFFKKDTEVPLRSTRVERRGWNVLQVTTNYNVISIGTIDNKYFDSIPKNWSMTCRDVMLGILYYPQSTKIPLNETVEFPIWLITPPHIINGNDTVQIQWKSAQCSDCFLVKPKSLNFNSQNFQDRQTLSITRVKDGPSATFIPNFNGGGFDVVPAQLYSIRIEK